MEDAGDSVAEPKSGRRRVKYNEVVNTAARGRKLGTTTGEKAATGRKTERAAAKGKNTVDTAASGDAGTIRSGKAKQKSKAENS